MDSEIESGDKIEVCSLYIDEDYVTLSGSGDYYITIIQVMVVPTGI